jgi:hypothetical protein
VLGLLLLALGIPRLLRTAAVLSAGPVLDAVREHRAIPAGQRTRDIEALDTVRRWSASASLLSELALLELLEARHAQTIGRDSFSHLVSALEAQRASLARAPASSDDWARLAFVRYALSGMSDATRRALELSFATGPREPGARIFRLQLVLREWERLGPELREPARVQARELARHLRSIGALIEVYRAATPEQQAVILSALDPAPADRALLERRLRWKKREPARPSPTWPELPPEPLPAAEAESGKPAVSARAPSHGTPAGRP